MFIWRTGHILRLIEPMAWGAYGSYAEQVYELYVMICLLWCLYCITWINVFVPVWVNMISRPQNYLSFQVDDIAGSVSRCLWWWLIYKHIMFSFRCNKFYFCWSRSIVSLFYENLGWYTFNTLLSDK